jgi:hypothetical protein
MMVYRKSVARHSCKFLSLIWRMERRLRMVREGPNQSRTVRTRPEPRTILWSISGWHLDRGPDRVRTGPKFGSNHGSGPDHGSASQIDNLYVSSLCLSYTVVMLKHPPCHDKLTSTAPRKKPTEFVFCETGPSEGVQSHKPVKCFMSVISSKLACADEI